MRCGLRGAHVGWGTHACSRCRRAGALRACFKLGVLGCARAVQADREALSGGTRELRNDDLILKSCIYYQRTAAEALRHAGFAAGVALLSNDRGMAVRSQVQCKRGGVGGREHPGRPPRMPHRPAHARTGAWGG